MAEGAGLLNRFTVKSRNGGSNPPLSAIFPGEAALARIPFLLHGGPEDEAFVPPV